MMVHKKQQQQVSASEEHNVFNLMMMMFCNDALFPIELEAIAENYTIKITCSRLQVVSSKQSSHSSN